MKFTFNEKESETVYKATLDDFQYGGYYIIEWKPSTLHNVEAEQYLAMKCGSCSKPVLRVLTLHGMTEYHSNESIKCRIIRKVSEIVVK